MDKFRLKREVRQFFHKDEHTNVYDLPTWKSKGIPEEILDVVERIYVDYGHQHELSSGTKAADLSGWSKDGNKAHFQFTIEVQDIDHSIYEAVSVPKLMGKIQKVINNYFDSNHPNF